MLISIVDYLFKVMFDEIFSSLCQHRIQITIGIKSVQTREWHFKTRHQRRCIHIMLNQMMRNHDIANIDMLRSASGNTSKNNMGNIKTFNQGGHCCSCSHFTYA